MPFPNEAAVTTRESFERDPLSIPLLGSLLRRWISVLPPRDFLCECETAYVLSPMVNEGVTL